jgi:codanin-1
MCKDDRMLIDNKDDELSGPDFLKATYDPLKLKRLNARLSTTPKPHYGPNPSPKFIGYQEFFKEFIDHSSSPVFHQCLKDSFANEIELIHKEIPDLSTGIEVSMDKDSIEDMFLKLRVLGKFLGYLVFYPYQYSISSFLIKDVIAIRNNVNCYFSYFKIFFLYKWKL